MCVYAKSHQPCSTLFDPVACSPPGSSVHGILQTRILEWVTIPLPRGSSWLRDWSPVSCLAGRLSTIWATREAHTGLGWALNPKTGVLRKRGDLDPDTGVGFRILFCFVFCTKRSMGQRLALFCHKPRKTKNYRNPWNIQQAKTYSFVELFKEAWSRWHWFWTSSIHAFERISFSEVI